MLLLAVAQAEETPFNKIWFVLFKKKKRNSQDVISQ